MLTNPLNLKRIAEMTGWEDDTYNLVPQTKKWEDRCVELMKDAIHNEDMFHPYSSGEFLDAMTYTYGLRGLSLSHVEYLLDLLCIPEPQDRRKQYMAALRTRHKVKEKLCLEKSEMTTEELNGRPAVHIEDQEMWDNAKRIMNYVVRESINTFEANTIRSRVHSIGGIDSKDRDMAIALNLCVRESFLRKKGNKYTVAAKGKRFTGAEVPDDEPTEEVKEEKKGLPPGVYMSPKGEYPVPDLTGSGKTKDKAALSRGKTKDKAALSRGKVEGGSIALYNPTTGRYDEGAV